jgi:hypothetical protein
MTTHTFTIWKGEHMSIERDLIVGRYYWVLVQSSRKAPEWQPARFTGKSLDSVGLSWDFVGFNSADGHHFLEVIEIGEELRRGGLESQYGAGNGMFAVSEALRTDDEAAP